MSPFNYSHLSRGERELASSTPQFSIPSIKNFNEKEQQAIISLSHMISLKKQGVLEEDQLEYCIYTSAKETGLDPNLLLQQAEHKLEEESKDITKFKIS